MIVINEDLHRSPLLMTMLNSNVPVDRDEEGHIILPDIFPIDDMRDYMEFCRIGLIHGNINVELFRYMGHDIEDDSEYSKMLIMMKNDGGLIERTKRYYDRSEFVSDCNKLGIKLYSHVKYEEGLSTYIITTTIVCTNEESLQLLCDLIIDMNNTNSIRINNVIDLYKRLINGEIIQFHRFNGAPEYINIIWSNSIRDYCLNNKISIIDTVNNIEYSSPIPNYISENHDEYYRRLFNEYIIVDKIDNVQIVLLSNGNLDNIIIPKPYIKHWDNVIINEDNTLITTINNLDSYISVIEYNRDIILYMMKKYNADRLIINIV